MRIVGSALHSFISDGNGQGNTENTETVQLCSKNICSSPDNYFPASRTSNSGHWTDRRRWRSMICDQHGACTLLISGVVCTVDPPTSLECLRHQFEESEANRGARKQQAED